MKAAAQSKTKLYVAIGLGIVALFMVTRAILSSGGGPETVTVSSTAAKASTDAVGESLDPRLHLELLANAEAVKYEGPGKNIFRDAPEEIPQVKVSPLMRKQQQAAAARAAAIPPPPPPISLKFFGYSNSKGERPKVFLSQGEDVWIAHEGDVVDRHYKIVHITPSAVEVEDLLNNNRQSIRLTQG